MPVHPGQPLRSGVESIGTLSACAAVPFRIGTIISLCGSCEVGLPAEMGTILECFGMPDPRLMCAAEIQSQCATMRISAQCCVTAAIPFSGIYVRRAHRSEGLHRHTPHHSPWQTAASITEQNGRPQTFLNGISQSALIGWLPYHSLHRVTNAHRATRHE